MRVEIEGMEIEMGDAAMPVSEGWIPTTSETYRNIRKHYLLTANSTWPLWDGRDQKRFGDWLRENGADIINVRDPKVVYAVDHLDIACGMDYIKIIDEAKFMWLLLKI